MHTIVITNGTRPLPPLPEGRVIAADGGLQRALDSGLSPAVLVGDLDSVSPAHLEGFRASGGQINEHPTDKNQTDLELAIDLAEPGTELVVVGGDGADRFDHLLGELAHIAHRAGAFASVTIHYPPSVVRVLTSGRSVSIDGEPGSIVSLVAPLGTAYGVTATGVRWPLDGEDLRAGSTRGLSNQFVDTRAEISLDQGTLLVVQPLTTRGTKA
jgi:thiamine pyrophosphokinase